MSIDDDQDLHVPTQAVWLELCLSGQKPRRASMFVPPHEGALRPRQRDLVALLENEVAFLPVREEGEGTPSIFNKATLVWVALGHDGAEAGGELGDLDEGEPLADQRHEVVVQLADGQSLAGWLLYGAPADHARVVDHLNAAGRFLRLWTAERLFLINKTFVERVVEPPLDLDDTDETARE